MIDVIIPAYNAHNTIMRTLSSIAMQENIAEIKVTIVDDCSDKPYDDIAALFSNMMNIQIVKMTKNGGPGVARQVGIDHTNGEYITCMDADDTLVSANSLLMLKNIMIEQNMDCVYGQFLEENDNGSMHVHEMHMVWMFGKLYKRSFLEHYNIRFNVSRQNEDTGFNCLVKGCTDRIYYVPQPVYIWHFKPNSITRIKGSMYGFESGYKGYIDNMIWQLEELNKRFVNKNYIMKEVISIMCVLYFFHIENAQNYPMNTDASINWCRGYYDTIYKKYEKWITPAAFEETFKHVQADQNTARKGVIPRITIDEFMSIIRAEPPKDDIMEGACGSKPAGWIPETTPEDWPVEIKNYECKMKYIDVDSDTNRPLYEGMQKIFDEEAAQKTSVTTVAESSIIEEDDAEVLEEE